MSKIMMLILLGLILTSMAFAEEAAKPDPGKPQPRFEKRPGFLVMGIEAKNAMEGDTMMKLWMDFFNIQPEIPETVDQNIYGITYYGDDYNPETMEGYSYLVGMEVISEVKMPEGLVLHKVPDGFYAVFEHHGKIEKIDATYEYIFGEWMNLSGFKSAPQDVFEMYGINFEPDSDESVMEIWVPVLMPESKP